MTDPSSALSTPRLAVLGCGYWGSNLVRVFSELGALAAVSDVDPAAAARASTKFGVPARSMDALLDDPAIDALVVATPAVTHGAVASEIVKAGKHVLVEKPLSMDVAEAENLCRLADDGARVLMVGHLMHYHPAFLELLSMVRSGRLGRVLYVYSNRLNFGRFRREENILWSFAPHDISMILSLIGSEPDTVDAYSANYLHEALADVTTTHLHFPGGERAHAFVSWLHPYKEHRLIVVGDRGMAVFDDGEPWESKLRLYPHQVDWKDGLPTPAAAAVESVPVSPQEPLAEECRHFLDCVRTGARPRTDGAEGLRVLRVLERAQSSIRAGGASSRPGGGLVHETAVVDAGVSIGEGTRIWHFSHVLAGSIVGADCTIGQNVMIGPDVAVGNRCKIQNNVSVYKGVTLEDGVFCGPSAVFTNVVTPRAEVDRSEELATTVVERGATIGANATIVCGNRLGAHCMIGAGAVVTSDVPPHALMVGVPARRVGWVSHAGERLGADLACPRTGRRYEEKDGVLREVSG